HSLPATLNNCTDCHGGIVAPEIVIGAGNDILFPHHTPNSVAAASYSCGNPTCHNASRDFRYVEIQAANHTYCNLCHDLTHDSPPAQAKVSGTVNVQSFVPVIFTFLTTPVVLMVIRRLF
ncbi:MAG: cytochrome c3 family protein, partial [Candidatus Odinarchaeota archaeon]